VCSCKIVRVHRHGSDGSPKIPLDHSPDEVVSDRWINALQMVRLWSMSVRMSREAKDGAVWGVPGVERQGMRKNGEAELKSQMKSPAPLTSFAPFDRQVGGSESTCFALTSPPLHVGKRSSGAPISTQEIPREFSEINNPCDGPNHRSLRPRVIPCLADFVGEFLQSKFGLGFSMMNTRSSLFFEP